MEGAGLSRCFIAPMCAESTQFSGNLFSSPLRGMKMLREVEAVDKEPPFLCSLSCNTGDPNLQDLMPDDLRWG